MDKKETPAVRQKAQKEAILEQLRRIPIVQVACEKAGISRATFYRMRSEDEGFRSAIEEAVGEGVAFINDMSESQIITLIKDKNYPAISFWLRSHHPAYRTKVEVNARIAQAPVELTSEQEAEIERAVKLASLVGGADNKKQDGRETIPGPENKS